MGVTMTTMEPTTTPTHIRSLKMTKAPKYQLLKSRNPLLVDQYVPDYLFSPNVFLTPLQSEDVPGEADSYHKGAHGVSGHSDTSGPTGGSQPEHNEKPGKDKVGSFQGEGDSGPTDLGKARAAQRSGQTPKEGAGK